MNGRYDDQRGMIEIDRQGLRVGFLASRFGRDYDRACEALDRSGGTLAQLGHHGLEIYYDFSTRAAALAAVRLLQRTFQTRTTMTPKQVQKKTFRHKLTERQVNSVLRTIAMNKQARQSLEGFPTTQRYLRRIAKHYAA